MTREASGLSKLRQQAEEYLCTMRYQVRCYRCCTYITLEKFSEKPARSEKPSWGTGDSTRRPERRIRLSFQFYSLGCAIHLSLCPSKKMFPGPVVSTRTSQCGQPLSRLAEIAEVVSRQQQLPVVPIVPIVGMARSSTDDQDVRISEQSTFPHDHPGSVSAALRKRSPPPLADIVVKRFKTVEENEVDSDDESEDCSDDMKDVRFREYQAEIWSEKFEDLCEFRRQYGHCHVPHTFTDNAPLAQWVKRQRYQYKLRIEGKRSTLSDERVRLLNQIGFIWNSHDVVWEERWQELLMFKHLHGHCIVPSNYDKNPQLAIWVKVRTTY